MEPFHFLKCEQSHKASAKRLDFSLDFSLYKNLVKNLVVWPPCIELYSIHFPCIVFLILIRDAGATVGQGGGRLEKGTCTNYDVILTSEF